MLGGGLYKAPLSRSPQRILDYGTGTGIYALDIAESVISTPLARPILTEGCSEFPSAEVIGERAEPADFCFSI